MPSDYNDWRLRQIEDEDSRREREELGIDEDDALPIVVRQRRAQRNPNSNHFAYD